jgi:DNA-binding PadR family transcriptional regulator
MHSHEDRDRSESRVRGQGRGRGRGPWMFEGPSFGPPEGGPWGAEGWGHGRGGRGGGRGWGRARRGDVRSAILALLAERPMHGYEIIGELSERTEGMWKPSAGSIYPTLQLLEDEGLIVADNGAASGKRRFSLTEEGRAAAAQVGQGRAPWEEFASGAPTGARSLLRTGATLLPVVRQVAMTGTQQQCEEAVKLLEETRRRLYAVLAAERPEGSSAS